jgi:hypothetical protein
VKKAVEVVRRREKGAQEVKVGSARKVAKKDGQAVEVKLVPSVELCVGNVNACQVARSQERRGLRGGEGFDKKRRKTHSKASGIVYPAGTAVLDATADDDVSDADAADVDTAAVTTANAPVAVVAPSTAIDETPSTSTTAALVSAAAVAATFDVVFVAVRLRVDVEDVASSSSSTVALA